MEKKKQDKKVNQFKKCPINTNQKIKIIKMERAKRKRKDHNDKNKNTGIKQIET